MIGLGLWQKRMKLLLIYAANEMGSYVSLLQDANDTGSTASET